MDTIPTVDEILQKLKIPQLKELIGLFGLDTPHSKSKKHDLILYISAANLPLDSRMLINYFKLELKEKKTQPQKITSLSSVDLEPEETNPPPKKQKK